MGSVAGVVRGDPVGGTPVARLAVGGVRACQRPVHVAQAARELRGVGLPMDLAELGIETCV